MPVSSEGATLFFPGCTQPGPPITHLNGEQRDWRMCTPLQSQREGNLCVAEEGHGSSRLAMNITCKKCDNVGRINDTDCSFESRGRFGLSLVYKCLKCKSGLLAEINEDLTVGPPEPIPDHQWFNLDARWSRQFVPSDMSENDRVELGLMLHSMFGFVHGYIGLLTATESNGNASPEQSFYLNALRSICFNYFVASTKYPSDVNVRPILAKHGLSSLVEPIDEILDTSLGVTNFKSIFVTYRNKFLTHELFQLRPLEKIYGEFDLRDENNWLAYHKLEEGLFNETVEMFYELRGRYPGAWIGPEELAP